MERFNGEVRDREKVMRGLKKVDTRTLAGYQIYHRILRESIPSNFVDLGYLDPPFNSQADYKISGKLS